MEKYSIITLIVFENVDVFRFRSAKQLHNVFRCVLLRLCKTFIEVLPKNTTTMGYE